MAYWNAPSVIPGAGGICAVNRVRTYSGKAWLLFLKSWKVFYHITEIVRIELPAAHVAVSKIYYEISIKAPCFLSFMGKITSLSDMRYMPPARSKAAAFQQYPDSSGRLCLQFSAAMSSTGRDPNRFQ